MKVTVELPESDMRTLCRMTGTRKKGPAIRKVLEDSLRLRRRAELAQKFLTGKWSADLETFEAAQAHDRAEARTLAEAWHD